MTQLRFYLDENISKTVAEQLSYHKIDAVSVHGLELLGDSDINHLRRATEMGRMLCTHDEDFFALVAIPLPYLELPKIN